MLNNDFKELDNILLKCINYGFSNINLISTPQEESHLTEGDKKRFLANKLRMLAHMIDEGLVL